MPLSKLSPVISAFVDATNAQDADALNSLFHSDAVLTFADDKVVGQEIHRWNHDRFLGASIHPINIAGRAGTSVLTVVAQGAHKLLGAAVPAHVDLSFTIRGEKVSSLAVAQREIPPLPAAVADFVLAMNTFDLESLVGIFRDDALVNDQLREIWGRPAISDWAKDEVVRDRMTMHVTDVVEHCQHIFVRANIDGDFDKRGLPDPQNVTFTFFLVDGRIAQLFILSIQSGD